ncbi:hypothetical protein [Herbidospora galbida]|nr:hypothetical protein [Herbidospora galbida]
MTSATQAYSYAAPSSLVDGRLRLSTPGGRALSGPVALLGVADVEVAL